MPTTVQQPILKVGLTRDTTVHVVFDGAYANWEHLGVIASHFAELGYDSKTHVVTPETLASLDTLARRRAYVFNHADSSAGDWAVQRYLTDRFGERLLGCGLKYLQTCLDPRQCQAAFAKHNIPTPQTVYLGGSKKLKGDASKMLHELLSSSSITTSPAKDQPRFYCRPENKGEGAAVSCLSVEDVVAHMQASPQVPFVVQPYLDGREWTVGVLLNRAMTPVQVVSNDDNDDAPAKTKRKRDEPSASEIPVMSPLNETLRILAERAFIAVGGDAYGLVHMREDRHTKHLYVLQIKPTCSLTRQSLMARSLGADGVTLSDFIQILMSHSKNTFMPLARRAWAVDNPVFVSETGEKLITAEYEYMKQSRSDDGPTREMKALMERENMYFSKSMAHTAKLQRQLTFELDSVFEKVDGGYADHAAVDIRRRGDYFYYHRADTGPGAGHSVHCRKKAPAIGNHIRFAAGLPSDVPEEELFRDYEYAMGEDFFALASTRPSPGPCSHYLLFAIDITGNENFDVYVKDISVQPPVYLDECLSMVAWNVRWFDESSFVYVKRNHPPDSDENRANTLYFHRIGVNAPDGSDDELLFDEADPALYLMLDESADQTMLILTVRGQLTSEVWLAQRPIPVLFHAKPSSSSSSSSFSSRSRAPAKPVFMCVHPRQSGFSWQLEHHCGRLFALTNYDLEDNCRNNKILNFPLSALENSAPGKGVPLDAMGVFLPENEDSFIEIFNVLRHHLIVWEWSRGFQFILVFDLSSGLHHRIDLNMVGLHLGVALPERVYLSLGSDTSSYDHYEPRKHDYDTPFLRLTISGSLLPDVVLDYDCDSRYAHLFHRHLFPGLDDYSQEWLMINVPTENPDLPDDMVMVSLLYKTSMLLKGSSRPGGNPVMLSGYGAYGDLSRDEFCPEFLPLLDRGFIYAKAFLRGDGHMGTSSYQRGRQKKKQNTFSDFWTIAQKLVELGYTSPGQIAISSRSAGGLLMGVMANRDEQGLFGCICADVPFLDVLGVMTTATLPWTAFEYEEWGNPERNEEDLNYLKSYCPLVNVRRKPYPPIMLTAGLHDSRVGYWEPMMWAQRIRSRQTNFFSSHVLMRTTAAGHVSDEASDRIAYALRFAFILDALGFAAREEAGSSALLRVVDKRGSLSGALPAVKPSVESLFFNLGLQLRLAHVFRAASLCHVFSFLNQRPDSFVSVRTVAQHLNMTLPVLDAILDILDCDFGVLEFRAHDGKTEGVDGGGGTSSATLANPTEEVKTAEKKDGDKEDEDDDDEEEDEEDEEDEEEEGDSEDCSADAAKQAAESDVQLPDVEIDERTTGHATRSVRLLPSAGHLFDPAHPLSFSKLLSSISDGKDGQAEKGVDQKLAAVFHERQAVPSSPSFSSSSSSSSSGYPLSSDDSSSALHLSTTVNLNAPLHEKEVEEALAFPAISVVDEQLCGESLRQSLAPWITRRRTLNILQIGGTGIACSLSLCKAATPSVRPHLYVWGPSIDRRALQEYAGTQSTVIFLNCNFEDIAKQLSGLGASMDVIVVNRITSSLTKAGITAFFQPLVQGLATHGRLVILDFLRSSLLHKPNAYTSANHTADTDLFTRRSRLTQLHLTSASPSIGLKSQVFYRQLCTKLLLQQPEISLVRGSEGLCCLVAGSNVLVGKATSTK